MSVYLNSFSPGKHLGYSEAWESPKNCAMNTASDISCPPVHTFPWGTYLGGAMIREIGMHGYYQASKLIQFSLLLY